MKAGMVLLVLAYMLSQYFRAFLAVLSPVLEQDLGATAEALAMASGLWFASFAAMQLPVGWMLDRIGPRRTAPTLMILGGGGGAVVMALAQSPGWVSLSMILIGIGFSPVLMASYYIVARQYPPAIFATFAAAIIGIGSFGNIGAALPTAMAIEAIGWRATLWVLAVVTTLIALALIFTIEDPDRIDEAQKGSVLDILKIPAIWPVLIMMLVSYGPAASIRGLWVGPYLEDVFDADIARIGTATLIMGGAMILANFVYGPLDRLLGTRKWVVFGGNVLGALCCIALWVAPEAGEWQAILLIAAIGFFGSSFPVIMAHGRSFIPPHLVGRGVTLLNLFGIGGVGIMQFSTGPIFTRLSQDAPPATAYGQLFGLFAIALIIGLIAYLFSKDRLD